MSILKLFTGPAPEKLEQKGDALFEAESWGQAKLEYERAFYKLEKTTGQDTGNKKRLAGKIRESREALAREHKETAENYLAGGYVDEARDMLALAFEVTGDVRFKQELNDQLNKIELQQRHVTGETLPDLTFAEEESHDSLLEESDDEYFHALCGPLPEEVQDAYLEYCDDFKTGFIALNRGDFQKAATHLARAMAEHPQPDSYIPLELAAAYLNLGRLTEAKELLMGFLKHHPEALPAYQLLCEIYWELKDFPSIAALLASVPEELAGSLAVVLLKGETLHRAGNFLEARDFYNGILDAYDWNDTIAVELAKTHESLGETESARRIYKEIMDRCTSCHARINPMIKHKYAELCFEAGMVGTDILELYLSLAQEIPDNAAHYHDRISRIYSARGNTSEAERFRSIS